MFEAYKPPPSLIDIIQTIVIALSIYMVIHLFIAQPNKVDGRSMFPTLHDRERIITSKIVYRLGDPKRGDIVVFTPPDEKKGDYIKRVLAIPGDTIELKNGQVYLNNRLLPEKYLPPETKTSEKQFLRASTPYKVPPDQYILLGDNRNFSLDSREFGPVKKRSIIGKAWLMYWPLNKLGFVKH